MQRKSRHDTRTSRNCFPQDVNVRQLLESNFEHVLEVANECLNLTDTTSKNTQPRPAGNPLVQRTKNVSSYYYASSILTLLYMCPIDVSSYYCINHSGAADDVSGVPSADVC